MQENSPVQRKQLHNQVILPCSCIRAPRLPKRHRLGNCIDVYCFTSVSAAWAHNLQFTRSFTWLLTTTFAVNKPRKLLTFVLQYGKLGQFIGVRSKRELHMWSYPTFHITKCITSLISSMLRVFSAYPAWPVTFIASNTGEYVGMTSLFLPCERRWVV